MNTDLSRQPRRVILDKVVELGTRPGERINIMHSVESWGDPDFRNALAQLIAEGCFVLERQFLRLKKKGYVEANREE